MRHVYQDRDQVPAVLCDAAAERVVHVYRRDSGVDGHDYLRSAAAAGE